MIARDEDRELLNPTRRPSHRLQTAGSFLTPEARRDSSDRGASSWHGDALQTSCVIHPVLAERACSGASKWTDQEVVIINPDDGAGVTGQRRGVTFSTDKRQRV